jgi:hypothetical protein
MASLYQDTHHIVSQPNLQSPGKPDVEVPLPPTITGSSLKRRVLVIIGRGRSSEAVDVKTGADDRTQDRGDDVDGEESGAPSTRQGDRSPTGEKRKEPRSKVPCWVETRLGQGGDDRDQPRDCQADEHRRQTTRRGFRITFVGDGEDHHCKHESAQKLGKESCRLGDQYVQPLVGIDRVGTFCVGEGTGAREIPQTIATCQSPLCAPVRTDAWTAPHPMRIRR